MFQIRNICSTEIPENYYLDNDNIYKECYEKCKKCSQSGNETINNCDEYKVDFIFINDSSTPDKNFDTKCNYYFYFDEMNQTICTESNICPQPFNKKIESKKKCIDECKYDDEYKYNYNNICLKECPENTKIDVDEKKCLDSCLQNQIEFNNLCYNEIPNDIQESSNNENNILMKNNDDFNNKLENILQQAYSPLKGKSLTIQRDDDVIFQITNSKSELELLKNKSNNIQNISIIDLGKCEETLRTTYNIDKKDSLIFIKSEKMSGRASEKKN